MYKYLSVGSFKYDGTMKWLVAQINITKQDENTFVVEVVEETATKHIVTVKDEDHQRLTEGKISKEELLKRSFEFLLKRESKESILSSFDITVISRYFPEYEEEIRP